MAAESAAAVQRAEVNVKRQLDLVLKIQNDKTSEELVEAVMNALIQELDQREQRINQNTLDQISAALGRTFNVRKPR